MIPAQGLLKPSPPGAGIFISVHRQILFFQCVIFFSVRTERNAPGTMVDLDQLALWLAERRGEIIGNRWEPLKMEVNDAKNLPETL